ncbi:hypothetical protein E3P81_03495 [Wallemia ichthyophaga]|nr:hypothetical protein E3P98_02602 [Wallemia ichthyophaga]TIA88402.1 hypothetical protein E3P97_03532 [Wallemia ichthyophaga]TIB44500.1 hypothetical protein E3P82_03500 [Wallemia ichthyophaga]TIB46930.1 hypothetical protein E3P81_03495 [Wallemia ichthyophaga]TIB49797.1 hypothetical protein E3P80_03504 [Wallemia ichthyophaga]
MLSGSIRRITNNSRLYSTVNKHEVDFFSKLSKHWWDESGEFGLLHKMNPVRAEFILKNINNARREDAIRSNRQFEDVNTLSGLTALDIGCGGGLLSETLARLGATTTGIDVTEANIKMAELHSKQDPYFNQSNLEYKYSAAEELLKTRKESFDLVCAMEVIEHVDKAADFLKTCTDLVKVGDMVLYKPLFNDKA